MRITSLSSLILVLAIGCGDDASLDRTIATLEPVRGETKLDEDVIPRVARGAREQTIEVGERGLARLEIDAGPQLLLDAQSRVSLVDETTISLTAGRIFAEAGEGEELA